MTKQDSLAIAPQEETESIDIFVSTDLSPGALHSLLSTKMAAMEAHTMHKVER